MDKRSRSADEEGDDQQVKGRSSQYRPQRKAPPRRQMSRSLSPNAVRPANGLPGGSYSSRPASADATSNDGSGVDRGIKYVTNLSDISEPSSPNKYNKVKSVDYSSSQEFHGGDDNDDQYSDYQNISDDDETSDGSCDCVDDDKNIRLSASVWKRKTGISGTFKKTYAKTYAFASEKATTFKTNLKLKSVKDLKARQQVDIAWERRKIVLDGRNLMYYHKKAEIDDYPNPEEEGKTTPLSKLRKSFSDKEKAKDLEKMKDAIKLKTSINTPRGVIDIVARRAVVSVSSTKSAPTPYSLCVAMKSEENWTVCFDEQKQLMKWLAALTDMNVKRSMHLSKRGGKGYHHLSSPSITQDKWIPPPKQSIVQESMVTGVEDTTEDEHDTEVTQDQHHLDDHEEMCEQVPLLNSVPKNHYNYSSEEPLQRSPSSAFISLSHQDVIILVAIINVSFVYICHLAIRHEEIFMSYLYIILAVNGGSFLVINRSRCNNLDDGANTIQRYQFTSIASRPPSRNTTLMRRPNQWESQQAIRSSQHSGTKPIQYGSMSSHTSAELGNGHMQQSSAEIQTIPRANLNGWKPKAGASMIRVTEPSDSCLNKDNIPMIRWLPSSPSVAQTRSAGYLQSKKKTPCPASLYELVRADLFESDDQMLEIGQKVNLSEIKLDYDLEENEKKTWNAPDVFVISLTLPTTAPKLGRTNNDDKGYILTGYYRMREETRQILRVVTRPDYDPIHADKVLFAKLQDENQKKMINGVKLWEHWCRCAPSDPEMMKKFKFVAKGDNLREVGCPSWICNYNGKPITIKKPGKTGFLFSYDNMMEFDLSLLPFPYLFKSAMTYLKENLFGKMLMTFSFIIEGRADDELPELLIGNGLQVCFLHAENVYNAKDVFAGTSPTSF